LIDSQTPFAGLRREKLLEASETRRSKIRTAASHRTLISSFQIAKN